MATNLHLSTTARNALLDALNAVVSTGGKLRFYDSTQPTNANTALGAQVLLADLALSATAFAAAGSGSIAISTVTSDSSADATGTATWFTITKSDNTRVLDGSVGTSGADMNGNTVSFVAGAVISCSSYTLSIAA